MSAAAQRSQMKHAPKLTHDTDGLVLVQLGERVVVFPSEADARFFFEAYTDVPNLIAEGVVLRGWINEEALMKERNRNTALAAEVEQLKRERDELQAQAASLAEKEAAAARRAKVLAYAFKHKITP